LPGSLKFAKKKQLESEHWCRNNSEYKKAVFAMESPANGSVPNFRGFEGRRFVMHFIIK
jgi:hypothetical protein